MKNYSLKVLLVGMMNIFAYGNVQAVTMSERMNSVIAVQKDSTAKKAPVVVFSGSVPPITPGVYRAAYKAIFVSEEGTTNTLMGKGEVVVGTDYSSVYLSDYGQRMNFNTQNWRNEVEKILRDFYKGHGIVSITILFSR